MLRHLVVATLAIVCLVEGLTVDELCKQPKDPGSCGQHHHRYWYNERANRCERYVFQGCGKSGHRNIFTRYSLCERKCVLFRPPPDLCKQRMDEGAGNSNSIQYAFNINSFRCERLYYKGAGGNSNRFNSESECMGKCRTEQVAPKCHRQRRGPIPARCNEPRNPGMGRANIRSYFFNRYTGYCAVMMYHGAGGNNNRFSSYGACDRTCVRDNTELVCEKMSGKVFRAGASSIVASAVGTVLAAFALYLF